MNDENLSFELAFKKINPEARSSILDRLNYLNTKDENLIDDIKTLQSN